MRSLEGDLNSVRQKEVRLEQQWSGMNQVVRSEINMLIETAESQSDDIKIDKDIQTGDIITDLSVSLLSNLVRRIYALHQGCSTSHL